jgi:hypothetical protein
MQYMIGLIHYFVHNLIGRNVNKLIKLENKLIVRWMLSGYLGKLGICKPVYYIL